MTQFRGFIAIDINATSQILEFKKAIEGTGADVKLVEPENIHITLKFLGDVAENLVDSLDNAIKEAVRGIKPYPLLLRKTGVFPNQQYLKVIWIGIEDGQTTGIIAKKLDEELSKLGFPREAKQFTPHLTIGRVKTARQKQQLLQVIERYRDTLFGEYTVTSVLLKKSELTPKGPIYTTVRDVRL